MYADEIKSQRLQERNKRFNEQIEQAAQKAVEAAAPEIATLRAEVRAYATSTADVEKVQTIAALLSTGVKLTDSEIAAYSEGAGYAVMKLLEKASGGKITAPKLEDLERDVSDLEAHFRNVRAYRGGMAAASTETFWGQSAVVGSVIQKGMIDKFPGKVDEITSRLSCISANR